MIQALEVKCRIQLREQFLTRLISGEIDVADIDVKMPATMA